MSLTGQPNQISISRRDVEAIANRMGLRFVFIKEVIQVRDTSYDPNIVHLFEPDTPIRNGFDPTPYNATLYYRGDQQSIRWGDCTLARIRKTLEKPASATCTCAVCYEAKCSLDFLSCPKCKIEICSVCATKMILDARAIAQIHRGVLDFPKRCVYCRAPVNWPVRQVCATVIAQIGELNDQQQRALLFVKNHDPTHVAHREMMQRERVHIRQIAAKCFRKGMRVKLSGLENQEWNGKKAIIIGGQIIKNGTVRWPVNLSADRASKSLIKQCNMNYMVQS